MAGEIQHLTGGSGGPDPLEERSLAPLILGLAAALLVLLGAALWDEAELRRPWKGYQRGFLAEAGARLAAEIESARRELEEFREGPAGRALDKRLAEAQAAAAPETALGGEIAALEARSGALQGRLEELRGRIQAASGKNLRLEAAGRPFSDPQRGALRAELAALDRELLQAETERAGVQAATARLREPLLEALNAWAEPGRRLADLELRAAGLADRRLGVEQLLLPATGEVQRCLSCHLGMAPGAPSLDAAPWRRHPGDYLVHHPVERFGCVCCHGGNGTALDGLAAAHGFEECLPRELRRGGAAQGSCAWCHLARDGRDRALFGGELAHAPELALGLKTFERNLCHGCHAAPGFPKGPGLAVPLDQVAWKFRPERVARILRDPAAERPGARMPRFHLSEEQIELLAGYVLSLPGERPAPVEWDEAAFAAEEQMDEAQLAALDAILERGARIWARVQCAACHRRGDKGGDIDVYAPELTRIGPELGREWLFRHLQAPAALFPGGRMPRVRLSEAELRDLALYLLRDPAFGSEGAAPWSPGPRPEASGRRDAGAALARDLGCAGCHTIPSHEQDPPAGNDLLDYGRKKPSDFDYTGRPGLARTVEAWTREKLVDPRAFGAALLMPVARMSGRETAAVASLLLGFSQRPLPEEWRVPPPRAIEPAGETAALFAARRCLTCHSLGGRGGDYAPELGHQGSRTGRAWLERFLEEPSSLRPRLVQMPQLYLPPAEVALLCDFFEMACRRDEWERPPREPGEPAVGPLPEGPAAEGAALALMEARACLSCHTWNGRGGVLGADIQNVGNRLRLGFLRRWLRNPAFLDRDARAPRTGLSGPEADLLAEYLHAAGRR